MNNIHQNSQQISSGTVEPLEQLFAEHGERLQRVIAGRMDRRLSARVDPADVLQDTFLDAVRRFDEYRRSPSGSTLPPFVWLRFLAVQRLAILRRRHLAARSRDARREVAMDGQSGGDGERTSAGVGARLAATTATPADAMERSDLKACLDAALRRVNRSDRQVLDLRHFKQCSNEETARALGVR